MHGLGPHAGSRPPWNRWYHHALTGPGGRHAFHHSDYHPDPAADRCAADVALQFRLGLWTRRTSRADLDHRAHLGAAWQILIAFARLPDVSAQISTESARIRPNHAATLCVIEGSAPGKMKIQQGGSSDEQDAEEHVSGDDGG